MTDKSIFKGVGYKSLDKQHGGKHYRSFRIQPAEFINENKLLLQKVMLLNTYADTLQKEKKKILRKQYII